jgi:NADH-quinone oxidoreductase subunit A
MRPQLPEYVSVLMLVALATAFTGGMLGLSVLLGKLGRRSRAKDTAYECGMVPEGEGPARLSVKFYVVAMLFILFDIEVVFLYPWAVVFRPMLARPGLANPIFFAMISFLGVLLVGYAYAVRKGAFDWRRG